MELSKLTKEQKNEILYSFYDEAGTLPDLQKQEVFNFLVNQQPPKTWVKQHPFIKGHTYLPIDKVEYLLRKIFKSYTITITGQGTAFNGVYVTVRVTYTNPVTGNVEYQDGIGASQLQTKKGTSPAMMENINNGAIQMAFPIAKTLAVKDACDHIGTIFGSDLNRDNAIAHTVDTNLTKHIGISQLMDEEVA